MQLWAWTEGKELQILSLCRQVICCTRDLNHMPQARAAELQTASTRTSEQYMRRVVIPLRLALWCLVSLLQAQWV